MKLVKIAETWVNPHRVCCLTGGVVGTNHVRAGEKYTLISFDGGPDTDLHINLPVEEVVALLTDETA